MHMWLVDAQVHRYSVHVDPCAGAPGSSSGTRHMEVEKGLLGRLSTNRVLYIHLHVWERAVPFFSFLVSGILKT